MKKTNKKPKLRKYSGGGEANYNPSDPNRTTSGTGTPFTINSGQGIAAGGAALQGGIGLYNSYNNPKSTPTDNYKSARNTEGAIVSSIAPAYGILHSAVGTTVDLASSQTNAGKMDASGNLTDRTMTKQDQVGKAFADPIAMLATRGSYKGGWTDITGNAYADSLEEQAKSDIATQKSQQEQQQAQQDQYNKMVNYYNQQNPQYSKGGKHRPKLLNPKFVSPQPGSQMIYGDKVETFEDGGIIHAPELGGYFKKRK